MNEFETYEQLNELVGADEGLTVVTAEQLRDAAGWRRLTQGAIDEIADNLTRRGLGYYPSIEPGERWAEVRVFRRGTPLGNTIEAVLEPTEVGDRRLREAASNDAADMIAEIRKMICT